MWRLVEDAAQGTHGDFAFLGHDRCVHGFAQPTDELDVATLLAGFHEARCFQAALDLAEGLRLKPPQSQPRSCEPSEGAWLVAAQSTIFQCFLQVCEGFFFRLPLARYIDFQTLRDKPASLVPDGSSKRTLHALHSLISGLIMRTDPRLR